MTSRQTMKQIWNPYLPLDEYIPDGEPHVFGSRIYVFGSHDIENGITYCMQDYVVWSAPVDDLTNWTNTGIVYRAEQDPLYDPSGADYRIYLYAPDVVQGNDGRFYLYYCMAGMKGKGGYSNPISVAVADKPDGKYEYLGVVHDREGVPLKKYVCFDPAVINDEGVIRLYYGAYYEFMNYLPSGVRERAAGKMYGRSKEQLREAGSRIAQDGRKIPGGAAGAIHVVLGDDMLTAVSEPVKISEDEFRRSGHSFFEASSIRKICFSSEGEPLEATQVGGNFGMAPELSELRNEIIRYRRGMRKQHKGHRSEEAQVRELAAERLRGTSLYYFLYSSRENHELCYAVSPYPDHGFTFGGVIISNGDVGYQGRKPAKRLNHTGNNHGGIERINGQWYVFYHRITNQSNYCRQGCAEPIEIAPDGHIDQVEMTTSGLNLDPLDAGAGAPVTYPAVICCNLTNGKMRHSLGDKPYDAPKITSRPRVTPFVKEKAELAALDTEPIRGDVTEAPGGTTIERFIGQITDGTIIGYKYFYFPGGEATITVRVRGNCEGQIYVCTTSDGNAQEIIDVHQSADWKRYTVSWTQEAGAAPLYLCYAGRGQMEMLDFTLG